MRAMAICGTPGCGEVVVRGKCPECESAERRAKRRSRSTAGGTPDLPQHWRAIRARYLKKHPHCECKDCLEIPEDERPLATDIHHKIGREEGGRSDDANLEALTHGHHSRQTSRQQPGGFAAFRQRDRIRSRAVAS